MVAEDKTALLLVRDNASWHPSQHARDWLRTHKRWVKLMRQGLRIITCPLPSKRPWLNPIEPRGIHAKRNVAEPNVLLPACELVEQTGAYLNYPKEEQLCTPERIP